MVFWFLLSSLSLGWQVTRVPPYVRRPFPSKEKRQISERDVLGLPVVPGGQEIGLGPRDLRPRATGRADTRERLCDWDGPMEVWGRQGVPHGQTESGV